MKRRRLLWSALIVASLAFGVAVARAMSGGPGADIAAPPVTTPAVSPSAEVAPTPSQEPTSPTRSPEPTIVPRGEASLEGAAPVVSIATIDPWGERILVGGFVAGVVEDGGTCVFTVTATDTGAHAQATTPGLLNVDSTSCGSVEIKPPPASETRTYTVTLEYSNVTGTASSASVTVEET